MFWERYKNECERIGRTPTYVARQLGFSSGVVTRWKNGSVPQYIFLQKLAEFFGCTDDYLTGDTDDRMETVKIKNNCPNLIIKLDELIRQNHLNRKQFLEIMDLSPDSITHWQKNKRRPSKTVLQSIANYFNVSVEYLTGEGVQEGMNIKNSENVIVNSPQATITTHSNNSNDENITALEMLLLQAFRKLTNEEQAKILSMIFKGER